MSMPYIKLESTEGRRQEKIDRMTVQDLIDLIDEDKAKEVEEILKDAEIDFE